MRLLYIFRNSDKCLCSAIFIALWSSIAAIQPQAGPWQPLVLILAFVDYIGLFLPSFCGLLLCLRVALLRPPWLGRAPGLVFPSLAHSCPPPPNTDNRCADPFIWGSILGLFQIFAVLFQKLLHFSSFFLGSEHGGGTHMAPDVCGGHMTFSGLGSSLHHVSLGIELRSSGLAASVFACWTQPWPSLCFWDNLPA